MYSDRTLSCLDCGQEFSFTAGEQDFYAQRGFTEPPKRCAGCRAARKSQRQGAGSVEPARNGGYGAATQGGGYSAAGGSAYGTLYQERRERELFEATCADCGATASVPFRPSGVRPVYCSNCFQQRR